MRSAKEFYKGLKNSRANVNLMDAKQAFDLLGGKIQVEKLRHMTQSSPQSVNLLTQVSTCLVHIITVFAYTTGTLCSRQICTMYA